jgi:hypothetical protein
VKPEALGFTYHMIVESNHTFFEALEDLGRGVFNNNREKNHYFNVAPNLF